MVFDNILGHDDIKMQFESNVKKHNISHSYLFYGDFGIGKFTFAKELAKILLNNYNLESCLDYKCISKQEDKKDIIIEQIRKNLIDDVYIVPISGEYKVYIINDAELLNVSAQNALLKTLEEPPKYAVIILVASSLNSMLPTILSRVSKVHFLGIGKELVNKYINKNLNLELPDDVVNYANGSIGKISEIVNDGLLEDFKNINKLYEYISKENVVDSLKVSQKIRFNMFNCLEYFEFVLYTNMKFKAIEYVEVASKRLKINGNYDIVIDNMILKIIDNI